MIHTQQLKYGLLLLAISIAGSSMAQESKSSIQLLNQVGLPFTMLNSKVFTEKPIHRGQMVGAELKIRLSKTFSFGLEGQYGTIDIKENVLAKYAIFNQNFGTVPVFSPSTYTNTLLNFYATKYSKSGRNLFEFGLGGGVQFFEQSENTLDITMATIAQPLSVRVFEQSKRRYSSPMGQLTLQNTFFIKPCLGITLGLKSQLTTNKTQGAYTPLNEQQAVEPNFQALALTEKSKLEDYTQLSLIPTVGIRFNFGACRERKPDKPISCFGLNWTNHSRKDTCFTPDKYTFAINQNGFNSSVLNYEVFMAPINDLNTPQLLFTLPYPSTSFFINSTLLESMRKYLVLVKQKDINGNVICVQAIQILKLCPDACRDSGRLGEK